MNVEFIYIREMNILIYYCSILGDEPENNIK